jgi:hypothetical protein
VISSCYRKSPYFHFSPVLFTIFLLAAILLPARPAQAVVWSTLFTAQDVRDHLSTEQGRQEALAFCRKMGVSKVYIESFRGGYQAEEATLKAARDFFLQAGLKVSGCVTTVGVSKTSSGGRLWLCYTNRPTQERLEAIFRFTAALFDEIMIDDFFCTDCQCSECVVAKGSLSWDQFREKQMLQISRERIMGPAHAVISPTRKRRFSTASGWARNSAIPLLTSGGTSSNTRDTLFTAGSPTWADPKPVVVGLTPSAPRPRFTWTSP